MQFKQQRFVKKKLTWNRNKINPDCCFFPHKSSQSAKTWVGPRIMITHPFISIISVLWIRLNNRSYCWSSYRATETIQMEARSHKKRQSSVRKQLCFDVNQKCKALTLSVSLRLKGTWVKDRNRRGRWREPSEMSKKGLKGQAVSITPLAVQLDVNRSFTISPCDSWKNHYAGEMHGI